MIGVLASILQFIYAAFLVGIGAVGMFYLQWELSTFYGIDAANLEGKDGATLLNQFKFLKSIELVFGIFSLIYRRDILSGGLNCTIFLTGLAMGALARASSWVLDGTPHNSFLFYLFAEVTIFCVVWLNAKRALSAP